ncbi:MAG: transposase, partial [Cyanobacteria bacterium P01_F01_bin.86]
MRRGSSLSPVKKQLRYRQRDPVRRQQFLRALRSIVTIRGSQDVVYVDESGFELESPCLYGWAPREVRVYGKRSGSRRPRQNLIAARRRGAFLAPLIISGTIT